MGTQITAETTFSAPDIECDGCANAIRKALAKVAGVSDVTVNVDEKTVFVKYEASEAEISGALGRIGFPVTVKGG